MKKNRNGFRFNWSEYFIWLIIAALMTVGIRCINKKFHLWNDDSFLGLVIFGILIGIISGLTQYAFNRLWERYKKK